MRLNVPFRVSRGSGDVPMPAWRKGGRLAASSATMAVSRLAPFPRRHRHPRSCMRRLPLPAGLVGCLPARRHELLLRPPCWSIDGPAPASARSSPAVRSPTVAKRPRSRLGRRRRRRASGRTRPTSGSGSGSARSRRAGSGPATTRSRSRRRRRATSTADRRTSRSARHTTSPCSSRRPSRIVAGAGRPAMTKPVYFSGSGVGHRRPMATAVGAWSTETPPVTATPVLPGRTSSLRREIALSTGWRDREADRAGRLRGRRLPLRHEQQAGRSRPNDCGRRQEA